MARLGSKQNDVRQLEESLSEVKFEAGLMYELRP